MQSREISSYFDHRWEIAYVLKRHTYMAEMFI